MAKYGNTIIAFFTEIYADKQIYVTIMNRKEKFFGTIAGIGFFGTMIYPAFVVALIVGAIGLNIYSDPATDDEI